MIKIQKNARWKQFDRLFDKDILKRYDWFLFEFGRRLTGLVHTELLGRLQDAVGGDDYKRRLVIGEIRERTSRVWWAIAAKAESVIEKGVDPNQIILTAVSRMKGTGNDPVREILEEFEPWTVDTLPFVPSLRQGIMIGQQVSDAMVEQTRDRREQDKAEIKKKMSNLGIDRMPMQVIWEKLKAVMDMESLGLRQEFGMEEGVSAWRPAIRYAKNLAWKQLATEEDLIRSLTDANFDGWKRKEHAEFQLTEAELKEFQRFQAKVRV